MVDRITEKQCRDRFKRQLQNNAKQIIEEFLSDPKCEVVRLEYTRHFDEIKAAIDSSYNMLRSCAEDIKRISPIIAKAISNEYIFFYELHCAIRDGILTKDVLVSSQK